MPIDYYDELAHLDEMLLPGRKIDEPADTNITLQSDDRELAGDQGDFEDGTVPND